MPAIYLFAIIATLIGLLLLWMRASLLVWLIFAIIITILAQTGLYFPSNQPITVLTRYGTELLTSPTMLTGWIPALLLLIAFTTSLFFKK